MRKINIKNFFGMCLKMFLPLQFLVKVQWIKIWISENTTLKRAIKIFEYLEDNIKLLKKHFNVINPLIFNFVALLRIRLFVYIFYDAYLPEVKMDSFIDSLLLIFSSNTFSFHLINTRHNLFYHVDSNKVKNCL